MTPRRFLFVTYEYPPVGGGMGKAARNLAKALVRRGHHVTILTSRFQRIDTPHDEGIEVVAIPVLRRHINYANAIEVMSFAVSGMLFFPSWSRRTGKWDVSLAFLTIPCGIVCEWARLMTRRPWLSFLRGQDVPGYPDTPAVLHKIAWPVTAWLWKHAATVLANSQWLANLARKSMPSLDIPLVPNGIDAELYCPLPGRPPNDKVIVVYTGRLVRFKRVAQLIEAWKLVTERATVEAELWIAGYGPERDTLEPRAAILGLSDSIRFLGRLEEMELIDTLRHADVYTSLSEGEGLPNAVLEAMSCALPVVLSDIGPHRELRIAEGGGLLCDATSTEAVAQALLHFIDNTHERQHHGALARQCVEKHFSWDAMGEQLLHQLEKAKGDIT